MPSILRRLLIRLPTCWSIGSGPLVLGFAIRIRFAAGTRPKIVFGVYSSLGNLDRQKEAPPKRGVWRRPDRIWPSASIFETIFQNWLSSLDPYTELSLIVPVDPSEMRLR